MADAVGTMMKVDTWIEPCAGMAAVAMRLWGLDPIIPWLGGKRAYAPAIMAGLGLAAGSRAGRLVLADAGPAGAFWSALLGPDGDAVVERIEALAAPVVTEPDARALWNAHGRRPEVRSGEDAAAWVLASGLSFRAGEVGSGYRNGTRDCDLSTAINRAATAPRAARAARAALAGTAVYRDARAIPVEVHGRTVVYLDPPYVGTTGYSADLSRDAVVDLARRWHAAGAAVLVSEREAVVPGWRAVRVRASGARTTKAAWEYVTLSPGLEWHDGEEVDLWAGMTTVPKGSAMSGGVR